MTNDITCRPATIEDVSDITKFLDVAAEGIFTALFTGIIPDVTYSQLMCGWSADNSQHYSYPNVVVAEKNGKVAGHIMSYDAQYFQPSDEMKGFLLADRYDYLSQYYEIGVPDKSLYIESLAVDKKLRSQGVGKCLIDSAVQRARNEGYEKLCLFVYEENDRGQTFHEREGFKLVKKFPLKSYEFLKPNFNRLGSRLMFKDI